MFSREKILTLYFLIFIPAFSFAKNGKKFMSTFEEVIENKVAHYASDLTRALENFNDAQLGKNSDLGKFIRYNDIKPKIPETGRQSNSLRQAGMMMLPLIFQIGATSTWMMMTTLLAAKSGALGLMLLIFNVAANSASVASFFTTMNNSKHHDHGWEWSPPPHNYDPHHHEHHEPIHYDHHHEDHPPYWTPKEYHGEYHTDPYKTYNHIHNSYEYKKKIDKNGGLLVF